MYIYIYIVYIYRSGPPDSQFARMVKNQKELPPSEWIDEKGMRFNFKAKV